MTSLKKQRILASGWGYPPHLWESVCSSAQGDCVLAHSFGLYTLDDTVFRHADRIFWYGGFFSSPPGSTETLRAFQLNPHLVLKKFRKKMFFPYPVPEISEHEDMDAYFLQLKTLVSFDYDEFWMMHEALYPKLVCVWGSLDCIVSDFREQNATCQKRSISSIIFEQEGHMPSLRGEKWIDLVKYA